MVFSENHADCDHPRVCVVFPTPAEPSITCPVCAMTSYHPVDIAEGYCGFCRDWTSPRSGAGTP